MLKQRVLKREIWFCVGMLLLAFLVRAHAIEALPPFNDESHHIRRAEKIYTFEDRNLNLTLGKLLSYYWIGFFHPERLDAIFVGRTASALFALLGLAATYGTGRLLFGRVAGRIALVLAAFSPFLIFFDRLALTDPLTTALGMMLVWASLLLVRREQCGAWCWPALLAGVLCVLVVMAKLLGLPMVAMPLIAVLVFGKGSPPRGYSWRTIRNFIREKWHMYRGALLTVYGIFIAAMLFFTGHVVERTIAGQPLSVVNNNLVNVAAEDKSPVEVVTDNLVKVWTDNWILQGPVLWLLILTLGGVLLWRRQREGVYLWSAVLLPWSLSVFFAAEMSTRYLTLGVPPALVIVGGGMSVLWQDIRWQKVTLQPVIWQGTVVVFLLAWLGTFALPFIGAAWDEPTELHLPERDKWEYFENFSAGYGLMAAAEDVDELPHSQPSGRVVLLGLVGSCHQMRLYLDEHGPVWLECLEFDWLAEDMVAINRTVQARLAEESRVYMLVEPELSYVDLDKLAVRWELVERYPRPFDGMVVELYRIYPLAENSALQACVQLDS